MAHRPENKPKPDQGSGREKGLTPIPQRIHCAATTQGVGANAGLDIAGLPDELNEIDQMAVDHFLTTLARVALAVASRRIAREGDGVA